MTPHQNTQPRPAHDNTRAVGRTEPAGRRRSPRRAIAVAGLAIATLLVAAGASQAGLLDVSATGSLGIGGHDAPAAAAPGDDASPPEPASPGAGSHFGAIDANAAADVSLPDPRPAVAHTTHVAATAGQTVAGHAQSALGHAHGQLTGAVSGVGNAATSIGATAGGLSATASGNIDAGLPSMPAGPEAEPDADADGWFNIVVDAFASLKFW